MAARERRQQTSNRVDRSGARTSRPTRRNSGRTLKALHDLRAVRTSNLMIRHCTICDAGAIAAPSTANRLGGETLAGATAAPTRRDQNCTVRTEMTNEGDEEDKLRSGNDQSNLNLRHRRHNNKYVLALFLGFCSSVTAEQLSGASNRVTRLII